MHTYSIISEALDNGVESFETLLDSGNFDELYITSIRNPEYFWGTLAKQFLQWDKAFEKVMDCNMEKGEIKWFTQGKLNISGELIETTVMFINSAIIVSSKFNYTCNNNRYCHM